MGTVFFTLTVSLRFLGQEQEIWRKAAESTQSTSPTPTKPDYLPGEVLVNFSPEVKINLPEKDQGPFSSRLANLIKVDKPSQRPVLYLGF